MVLRPKPPITIPAGSTEVLEFSLSLIKGDVAQNPIVFFFSAPDEFKFPDSTETWCQKDVMNNQACQREQKAAERNAGKFSDTSFSGKKNLVIQSDNSDNPGEC